MFKKLQNLLFASVGVVILLFGASCSSLNKGTVSSSTALDQNGQEPLATKEFRAAWVATVANINWPSKPGLSTEEQQKEAIALLDFLKNNNFNAVIFQVRPQADALYNSELEPWSYFLTGKQGQAPVPYYDPLDFWVNEAHDRGLELHVWLNPYRAHHISAGEVESASIVHKMSNSVVKLKEGYWWFDPSKKSTQDHSAAVVMDLVKRYDIDGVHFDDYFYPYESYNGGADFPDDDSWSEYVKSGGKLSRGDWRRESVNQFIERVYGEIKAEKKHVKFGLSPFGVWRPGFPSSIAGMDQYDKLYADARLWLNKGWIDYFSPQLYWPIRQIPQSFPVLLDWWEKENHHKRHLWPGLNVGLGGDDRNLDEVLNQLMITRAMLPNSPGAIHWSISPLVKYNKLSEGLLKGPYKAQALIPASPWLGKARLSQPKVMAHQVSGQLKLSWEYPEGDESFKSIVYYRYGTQWDYKIMGKKELALSLDIQNKESGIELLQVEFAYIDRFGNESQRQNVRL